jgi:hypothetical protein
VSSINLVGQYIPQKNEKGDLLPKQCWSSTGLCWCVYDKGIPPFPYASNIACPDKIPTPFPNFKKYVKGRILKSKYTVVNSVWTKITNQLDQAFTWLKNFKSFKI